MGFHDFPMFLIVYVLFLGMDPFGNLPFVEVKQNFVSPNNDSQNFMIDTESKRVSNLSKNYLEIII